MADTNSGKETPKMAASKLDMKDTKKKRAAKLDACFNKWLQFFLHKADYVTLGAFLPHLAKHHKTELENAQGQMSQYMKEQLINAYKQAKEDYQFVEKLNRLDELIEEAYQSNESPKHKRFRRIVPEPQQVIRSHMINTKMQELQRLRETESKLKARNMQLMSQMREMRQKLSRASAEVATVVLEFEATVSIASTIPTEELIETMEGLELMVIPKA
ncbi:uncharacterized protein BYT42DRAFT_617087 [Radiomyces spectabilis]|uniref:uncharacterized protein n=1 Tax=Radiomyces spectabilis TaxID=64574 RepID=UPI002220B7DF|nr:uncharacterized protein BYT42DRAFT_617087 [Radiomyces spectabilis]KAI8370542.1 hypothetical protein BYT42DRAFT_617087 [Radiomyces spectabilis]